MGGLVAQLHSLPALVGEVQLGVKGAHRLIGDLALNKKKKKENILLVALETLVFASFFFCKRGTSKLATQKNIMDLNMKNVRVLLWYMFSILALKCQPTLTTLRRAFSVA